MNHASSLPCARPASVASAAGAGSFETTMEPLTEYETLLLAMFAAGWLIHSALTVAGMGIAGLFVR